MFTGIIKTTFSNYKINGNPYKVCYCVVGGSWRVPCYQVDAKGKGKGINTSAGFRTEKEALDFYNTGKPAYSIY